ncbi:putative G-type lectin S-receptor-like serine/threonine-protein kinase At1g61610 isoform X2 [Panicum hallii]|uniref:putative G-type lectin S-receptor-like serine/threonine-protein kinase At1g61610 isoform X2 n=1 Tax=Panicum hallii TaxID=206008 RepID=UPI000DF4F037|nr:putative G-type lectin S-receptor-like serine/threonine-protein kinase At1g61610 isoform X2 [Panicum hallii]
MFSLGAVIIIILTGRADYIRISNRSSQEFIDLTVKNWSKRLQQTFSGSPLELCCHQLKKCMEVAFRCVEEDRHERPGIVDVIYALNEIDDTIDWMEDGLWDKQDVEGGKTEGSRGMPWSGTSWFWGLRWWLSKELWNCLWVKIPLTELKVLECIVDGREDPSNLKLPLLELITKKFANELRIGNGGCGEVYKGVLQNKVIAVKKLHSSHTIEDKMFHQEVQSLIMVKHQNMVRFLGYCLHTEEKAMKMEGKIIMAQIRERLLCFDYMSKGSLENHLTGSQVIQ